MGEVRHGTLNGYDYYKCRCDLCKAAKSKRNSKSNAISNAKNKASRPNAEKNIINQSVRDEPAYKFIGKLKR